MSIRVMLKDAIISFFFSLDFYHRLRENFEKWIAGMDCLKVMFFSATRICLLLVLGVVAFGHSFICKIDCQKENI